MSATLPAKRTRAAAPSRRYLELVRRFPLRPLRSRADADAATEILDRLFGRDRADRGEDDYVQALALLLSSYEDQNRRGRAAHVSAVEVLQHLASESGMKQTELAAVLGVGPSAASMILRGERPITAEHARRLGRGFKVQPGLFL